MRYLILLVLGLFVGVLPGCGDEDESVGENLEDAVEEAGDEIEDATDD